MERNRNFSLFLFYIYIHIIYCLYYIDIATVSMLVKKIPLNNGGILQAGEWLIIRNPGIFS